MGSSTYSPQYDDLPPIGQVGVSPEPKFSDILRRKENQFSQSLIDAAPSEKELQEFVADPTKYVEEQLTFFKTLYSEISDNPAFRAQLAGSLLKQYHMAVENPDAGSDALGALVGATIFPGGVKRKIEDLLVPEFKGEFYLEEIAHTIKQPEALETLKKVTPLNTGNPVKDFMYDHLPPNAASLSPYARRAYTEFDFGLIDDKTLADRLFASQTLLKGASALKVGVKTAGAAAVLYVANTYSPFLTNLTQGDTSGLPSEKTLPLTPKNQQAVDTETLAKNCNQVPLPQADLQLLERVKGFLQDGRTQLSPEEALVLQCVALRMAQKVAPQALDSFEPSLTLPLGNVERNNSASF